MLDRWLFLLLLLGLGLVGLVAGLGLCLLWLLFGGIAFFLLYLLGLLVVRLRLLFGLLFRLLFRL